MGEKTLLLFSVWDGLRTVLRRIPNFSPFLGFGHALGVVLGQQEVMCVFLITAGFSAGRSLPIPGSSAAEELLLAHSTTGHRMCSPSVRAGLVCTSWSAGVPSCWPPSLGNPAHTPGRMLRLPVTGYLQLGFIGAGLLQACTACVPWYTIHPLLPVSGRFLTSESFQFCYWRAPDDFLLHACSSYCSVPGFTAVLCLFEIRAFILIFNGSFLPLSFAVKETVIKNNPNIHLFKRHGFQKSS